MLHWHRDRILLPTSAKLIASSHDCQEQLFQIGSFALGKEFNVEVDDNMANQWINEDSDFIRLALGNEADSFLKKQQKQYGNRTLQMRLYFLRRVFDLIDS